MKNDNELVSRLGERIRVELEGSQELRRGEPVTNAASDHWRHRFTVLLLWLAVSLILFLRQPGAVLAPSFFAEDGKIFFKQAYEQSFLHALFTYYMGYLLIVPRLLAEMCCWLPLEWAPRAYAVFSLLISAACLTFFFTNRFRTLVPSDAIRALVVIAMTFMPISAEMPFTLANIQWFLVLFGVLCTVATLPNNHFAMVGLLVAFGLAATSAPALVTTLPVLGVRVWAARRQFDRLFWLVAAAIVVVYAASAGRSVHYLGSFTGETILGLVQALGLRVVCFFVMGTKVGAALLQGGWSLVLYLSTVAIFFMILLGRETWKAQPIKVAILVYYVCGLPLLLIFRPAWLADFVTISDRTWAWHGRYFSTSLMLLCVMMGICIANNRLRSSRPGVLMINGLFWLGLHAFTFRL
ncbi:MAG TPA: hypothetical protein VNX46_06455, partial [Candidatus Acidoferrum sp.]|nr:hypothetical protein [Candidatus Acidoferrum sp.]